MTVQIELDGYWELRHHLWSGALDTLDFIEANDKEDEFMDYIEEMFYEDIPSLTDINDFVWFERDMIFEDLEIDIDK